MKNSIATRERFQGMRQILRYNWRFYARAAAGLAAALLVVPSAPLAWRASLLFAAVPAAFWLCSSLLVSYYVYDYFPLYELQWLARCLSQPPIRWVNIHAGVDDSSHLIAALFPSSEGHVLDIYDPKEMTEPSIEEARRITPARVRATAADWRALPLPDDAFDAAFLIFAAHELRRDEARVQLFREIARVLRTGGELFVVEHLRDWANFIAFGPGFLHFLPGRVWRQAASAAGLRMRSHFSLTPFVYVFVLRRPA
jgi:SAM-dependent methyltransferase